MNQLNSKKKICIDFLKGICQYNDKTCINFHPILLKNSFAHWSLSINDFCNKFSIIANPIGFSRLNKNKIISELLILLKNLSIYATQITDLHLSLYDKENINFEDPLSDNRNDEEIYDKIFQKLGSFKYLESLTIGVVSLYPMIRCKLFFASIFEFFYGLKKLCIEMNDNCDDRKYSEYDYNVFLDVLARLKLKKLNLRFIKPADKDRFLMNLISESIAEKLTIEYKKYYKIKFNLNFIRSYYCKKEINIFINDEYIMNKDKNGILQEINKKIANSSYNTFNCYLDSEYKPKELLNLQVHWLFFFDLKSLLNLRDLEINFSKEFLYCRSYFDNFIDYKLMKLNNLRKIHLIILFYYVFEKKKILNLVKLIEKMSPSLQFLSLENIRTNVNWENLFNLFRILSKMKKLVCVKLKIIDRNINIPTYLPELSRKIRRMFQNNTSLINFDIISNFRGQSIKMTEQYNFFLRKKRIFVYIIAALKKSRKFKYFRKKIFIENFIDDLRKKRPLQTEINKNVYELGDQSVNLQEMEFEDNGDFNTDEEILE